jgi:hypothetical protein
MSAFFQMRRIQSEKAPLGKRDGKIYHLKKKIFLSNLILCLDADYDIIISTGDKAFEVPVTLRIRGDNGIINIPLIKTKTDEKPFQSKSTHEFTCRTTDVGKIKRITIEHQGTDQDLLWHLKTIQIKKGNDTYKSVNK